MSYCPIRNDNCVGGYKTEAQRHYGDIETGCAWWDYKHGECLVKVILEKIFNALTEPEKGEEEK